MKISSDSREFARPTEAPVEVFYVVRTTAVRGKLAVQPPSERQHRLSSPLYEKWPQAHDELARLQRQDAGGVYSIWKSETYVGPGEWLHRVVRADGTIVLPRLHGTTRGADA
jgi:hypothetical protein